MILDIILVILILYVVLSFHKINQKKKKQKLLDEKSRIEEAMIKNIERQKEAKLRTLSRLFGIFQRNNVEEEEIRNVLQRGFEQEASDVILLEEGEGMDYKEQMESMIEKYKEYKTLRAEGEIPERAFEKVMNGS